MKQVVMFESNNIQELEEDINESIESNSSIWNIIDIKYNHIMRFYESYSDTALMIYTAMIIYEEISSSVPKEKGGHKIPYIVTHEKAGANGGPVD